MPRAGLARTRLPPQHFSTQLKAEEVLIMISGSSLLVSLVRLVDQLPFPPPPAQGRGGGGGPFGDGLSDKVWLFMIFGGLTAGGALWAFFKQAAPVAQQLRPLLPEHGGFPPRRTWDRRLATLPATLPSLIG